MKALLLRKNIGNIEFKWQKYTKVHNSNKCECVVKSNIIQKFDKKWQSYSPC